MRGIEPTRVGQDPDPRARDPLRLWPWLGIRAAKGDAEGADSKYRDPTRRVFPDFSLEAAPASDQFIRRQLFGLLGGAGDDIC